MLFQEWACPLKNFGVKAAPKKCFQEALGWMKRLSYDTTFISGGHPISSQYTNKMNRQRDG